MTIALILIKKMMSLFLIMLMGIIAVKVKLLDAEESRSLSMISLYLALPCVIISSFCTEYSNRVLYGLLLTVVIALLMHGVMFLLIIVLRRRWSLDPVEIDSVIYSNSSSFVIPLVMAVLGTEWVIYCTGFMAVQLLFTWSHGKMIMCGETKADLKKVLCNPNILATFAGIIIFLFHIRLPDIAADTLKYTGDMIAALGMLTTGLIVAGTDISGKKLYVKAVRSTLLRLIICPLLCLLLVGLMKKYIPMKDAQALLLVPFLQVITPSGLSIMQMAKIYDRDAAFAGAINIMTTLAAVVTMPFFIWLYFQV